MIRNYIAVAWRNIRKNTVYSIVNIAGLAVGLACTIAIGLYVWDEYDHDRFHTHFSEIYRVVEIQDHEGVLHPVAATPGPLARTLKKDYGEIIASCRLSRPQPGILTREDVNIEPEKVVSTDNTFFAIFDFRLLKGNAKKVLLEPDEIVITASIAEQLFGPDWQRNNKIIGEILTLNNTRDVVIAGVAEDCPPHSHIQFDVLLSMRHEEVNNPNNALNWDNHNYHTYIKLHPGASAPAFEDKIRDYLKPFAMWAKPVLFLQPLEDVYLNSHFDYGDWSKTGSVAYLRIFTAVGIVVLLIAVFNFINLSTARATQRGKEVGVRKVIGAARRQLVTQFLSESVMMTMLAVLVALLLLKLFVPILNDISGKALAAPLMNLWFVSAIFGFTLFIGFFAGLYPALYLSGFQPIKVLKGFFKVGSGRLFRCCLVVTQFILSVTLVVGAIVIARQLAFVQNKDLGFDKDHLIFLRLKNQQLVKRDLLKSDLRLQTSIQDVALTSHNLIDMTGSTHGVKWEGQEPGSTFSMCHMNVDADFLTTTGMVLVAGRNFDSTLTSDSTSWLINETAASTMGWTPEEAVDKTLELWSTRGTIVGVVKDFHFRPMSTLIEPMLFHYWPGDVYSYQALFIRTQPGSVREAISAIGKIYKKHDVQTAPHYQFVDEMIQARYRTEQNTGRIVLYFSILAIFVSCLGLFGLTTFMAEQRTREIGIRKTLGASVLSVVSLLSKDFVLLVAFALVMAAPLGWWIMSQWLQTFVYRIEMEWWMIASSGAMAIGIALLTVSFQSIKAATRNPANSLRTE